jgi:HK97 family phage portal protein
MENVNPHHNARDLKEFTTMFSDLTGECYWLIIDDELGIPGQIWVIPSQHMTPKYGKSLDKAIESYIYRRGNKEIEIPERQIVMFTYPNPNNIFKGFSCVQGIADAVYVQNQMNEFEAALFENRARIGGVVTQKEKVSEPDLNRLRESFKQKHHGAKQAGKTMFLPYGMEFNRDTMSPEELSFIEGRKLNRTEIMAAFDVPEGILTAENVNRSNAEVAAFTHAKYGIFPRCERFAQKINERILPRYGNEANRLFCAFEEVIPEDREFNLKERTESVRGNIITINEARSQIGLDPVDWGDVMWMPFNTSPVEPWKEEETPPPPQEPEVIEGEMVERVKGKIREWLNA